MYNGYACKPLTMSFFTTFHKMIVDFFLLLPPHKDLVARAQAPNECEGLFSVSLKIDVL